MTIKMEQEPANADLGGPKAALTATVVQQSLAQHQNVVNSVLGSVVSVRREIDDVLADMRVFHKVEPDQVMNAVSAHSARLVEIVVQIVRIETMRREWKPVREEAERVITELKNQFQIASRSLAVRQMDWEFTSRGQV